MKLPRFPVFGSLARSFCLGLWSGCVLAVPGWAGEAGRGSLSGRVSNADTKVYLDGVVVAIAERGLATVTDTEGRFAFEAVPAGAHQLVTSYLGLDGQRTSVVVRAGERTEVTIELRSSVYKMDSFIVSGEREGNAASITRQRNSANVRTVLALDALGSLPSENMGELLIRMPGIGGGLNEEGVIATVGVRGTAPALNTLTIDGDTQPGSSTTDRTPRTHTLSGALFDEIEVIKAPTPDMRADSLGGSINIKTRSALNLQGGRRGSYKVGARWAPPFLEHIPMRRDKALHPQLGFGYQEVFSVGGGRRNLGLSIDGSYSETMTAYYRNINYYRTNTTEEQAGTYQNHMADVMAVPKQFGGTLKVEYRLADRAEFFATVLYSDASNPFYRLYSQTAVTGQTVATIGANGQPTGTGALLPGYTNQLTQVRGVAASTMRLETDLISTFPKDRKFTVGGRHNHGPLKFDYSANYSSNHNNVGVSTRHGNNGGGVLQYSFTGVGWILDQTRSAVRPILTQTEGPDWYNVDNYRTALLVKRDSDRLVDIYSLKANAGYTWAGAVPVVMKTGVWLNREDRENVTRDKRWNYVGTGSLARLQEPNVKASTITPAGRRFPYLSASLAAEDVVANPGQWRQDVYTDETLTYRSTNQLQEDISAAYLQGETRFRGLRVLGGVRAERVEDVGQGFVQARVLSTTAQRTADPVGAARADWNNPKGISGRYTDFFPSVHLVQRLTDRLQARLSWSNSIGRPAPGNLLPVETPNNTTLVLTVNNPALQPQYSENWDAALEYYFEPIGQLTVGYFRKDIRDFLFSANIGVVAAGSNNGFGGEYAGYQLNTTRNGGSAQVEGWELSYQQELTFLPGLLRGLGVYANLTDLKTEGDYGVPGITTTATELVNFVPRTTNAGVSFRYRGLMARLNVSYTSSHLTTGSTAAVSRVYLFPRTILNTNLSYQLGRGLSVFGDVANLTDEPQRWYLGHKGRPYRSSLQGGTVTLGLRGTF
jgi:TonB-dependent receptor